jgi:branched-chain amino acid transport system permease protein
MIAIFGIVAVGTRLVLMTGQWTFGQAVFMTVGSYASAMLTSYLGLSFWLALPIAGIAAAVFAILFGYPTLRLKGAYFTIVTLVLNIVVRQIILVTPDISGGSSGFRGTIPYPEHIFLPFLGVSIEFAGKVPFYYLIWFIAVLSVMAMYAMEKSQLGIIFRAIKQSDILAQSVGINIGLYKLVAFAAAGFFAGLAGSFYTHYFIIAHPDALTMWDSIFVVTYAVIGGMGSTIGPILGSALLIGGFEVLRVAPSYQAVGFSLILLLVTRYLPGGIIGLCPLCAKWIGRIGKKNANEQMSSEKQPQRNIEFINTDSRQ